MVDGRSLALLSHCLTKNVTELERCLTCDVTADPQRRVKVWRRETLQRLICEMRDLTTDVSAAER
jgi:predicted PP-loop superfamily ATPase